MQATRPESNPESPAASPPPVAGRSAVKAAEADGGALTFGFITDVHHGTHGIVHGAHHLTPTSSTFGMPFGGNTTYFESSKPPFTFITLDTAKREIRIEEARSSYEGEAEMKPELVWIDPALIRGRVLAFGG